MSWKLGAALLLWIKDWLLDAAVLENDDIVAKLLLSLLKKKNVILIFRTTWHHNEPERHGPSDHLLEGSGHYVLSGIDARIMDRAKRVAIIRGQDPEREGHVYLVGPGPPTTRREIGKNILRVEYKSFI